MAVIELGVVTITDHTLQYQLTVNRSDPAAPFPFQALLITPMRGNGSDVYVGRDGIRTNAALVMAKASFIAFKPVGGVVVPLSMSTQTDTIMDDASKFYATSDADGDQILVTAEVP